MRARAACAILLAACSQAPLSVAFEVTSGSEDTCYAGDGAKATSCSDVALTCPSVVSIRIYSPDQEASPFVSVCKQLLTQPDLCAIASVDLPQPAQPVPDQTLEVEIAVFPYSAVTVDPSTGDLVCPTGVVFDDAGFPVGTADPCTPSTTVECPPTPAIGGRAYYHPGDPKTVVALGCVDVAQVDSPTCSGGATVAVTATVNDFDTDVSVPSALGDTLSVSIGQPKPIAVGSGTQYQLDSADAVPLARTVEGPVPAWGADVTATFTTPCIEVLEDGAQTTASLSCSSQDPAGPLALGGWRLAKSSLAQILGALGDPAVPDQGLVVGIVLDPLGNPLAGEVVSASAGTVQYLSADRTTLGSGATSSSGVFVSTDAPFGTRFAMGSGTETASALGGLVEGKVTVAVLQYENPVVNP